MEIYIGFDSGKEVLIEKVLLTYGKEVRSGITIRLKIGIIRRPSRDFF